MVSLNKHVLLIAAGGLFLSCCMLVTFGNWRSLAMPRDCVLEPGMSVFFQNQNGSGKIKHLGRCKRNFELSNGITRAIDLLPRKEPFLGKWGLYEPASKWFYEIWKPRHRLVIEESLRHFENAEQIHAELYEGRDVYKWVWNDQGYVVGFFTDPVRHQTNVCLYRFLIGGKPFTAFPPCEGGFVNVLAATKEEKPEKKNEADPDFRAPW